MGITKRCKRCGKQYKLGVKGTKDGCDKCLGIARDGDGHFWLPSESGHTYQDIETERVFTVKREDAFRKIK